MMRTNNPQRRGAVIPLFGLMLPVLITLAAIAINVSYMQLTRTELKVATDASARAGGRAWSEFQTISKAKSFARAAAKKNYVAGEPLNIRTNNAKNEIEFGLSQRSNNGYGRYVFTKKNTTLVAKGSEEATSIRITGKRDAGSVGGAVSLLLGGVAGISDFEPVATSVCTQVDRDIALILDRSGSMIFHKDYVGEDSWDGLYEWCDNLMDHYADEGGHWESYWKDGEKKWRFIWDDTNMETAYGNIKSYKDDVVDYRDNGGPQSWENVPTPSRWDALRVGVHAFLNVLEDTDQEEHVSLGSFSSDGKLELSLQTTYDSVRNWVDTYQPYGGTAIDKGLTQSYNSLYGSLGRPYAAKTIVVMTDGQNNSGGQDVINAAKAIIGAKNITIHAVTYSLGADQATMASVAKEGNGKHFHANDASGLVEIFEEIANNLPTIITE